MKDKVAKYKAERERNVQKMELLRQRNIELDALILEEENLKIVAMVRSMNIGPEQLAALFRESRAGGMTPFFDENMKGDAHEE